MSIDFSNRHIVSGDARQLVVKLNGMMDDLEDHQNALELMISGGANFLGEHDASGGTYPAAPAARDAWIISVAGTISGVVHDVGDIIFYSGTAWYRTNKKKSFTDSITAGTTQTQAGATALTSEINRITTCATAGDGVKLPSVVLYREILIINDGAADLRIWPPSGTSVVGGAANAADPTDLPPGESRAYVATDATNYRLASGGGNPFDQDLNTTDSPTFEGLTITGSFRINNPADTFKYTFAGSAITADRTITLPLLTGDDTLAVLGLAQTWTGAQTFAEPLVINKNASNSASILSSDVGAASLIFGNQSDAATAAIVMDHSTNTLYIRGYNNTNRMSISSAGDVSISTGNLSVIDANFYLRYDGTNPIIQMDSGDYQYYSRASNYWSANINGVDTFRVDNQRLMTRDASQVAKFTSFPAVLTLADGSYHSISSGTAGGGVLTVYDTGSGSFAIVAIGYYGAVILASRGTLGFNLTDTAGAICILKNNATAGGDTLSHIISIKNRTGASRSLYVSYHGGYLN